MIKNFICLTAVILFTNCALAADGNYGLLIERQSDQIQELNTRITKLEQVISSLTNKTPTPEAIPEITKPNTPALEVSQVDTSKTEYDLALASLKDGKFDEAEIKFADFLQKYPKHKLRENALFWYGDSFFRRDDFNQAAIHYLKGYKEYPKGSKATDSLLKLSLSLGALDKTKEACSILDKLNTEFPSKSANIAKRAAEAKGKFGCGK